MAKQSRPRSLDLAVYLTLRTVAVFFQVVPVAWALGLAELLARVAYRIDRRHRLVAADNLRHAFPHWSEAEIDSGVRASYRHLFLMVVETVILKRQMRASTLDKYVRHADEADRRRVQAWGRSGRPTIVLTGHFGNWEVMNFAIGLEGVRATVVARALDNPYLDRFVRSFRESSGIRMVDKSGSLDAVAETLAAGGNLGLVGDQDAGPRGQFVDFFGRPASTFKSIALLALEYHAVIVVISCVRGGGPLCHVMALEDEIRAEEYDRDPNAVRAITERYTAALERAVRRHPDQYFWLHRRWKHQPKARPSKRAA